MKKTTGEGSKRCCDDKSPSCNCSTGETADPFHVEASGSTACCGGETASDPSSAPPEMADAPCCGLPPGPRSAAFEKPGYTVCPFVEDFVRTASGSVPRVKTRRVFSDLLGTARARIGVMRNDYRVVPGLYAMGNPGPEAPVLVSANYKLSFDRLRLDAAGLDAWILVIDTRGINVWCAAGKALFSTGEVVRGVRQTALDKVVSHRRLILPQLSATGVSAQEVKSGCGFRVVWGPVRAGDIRAFLDAGMKAGEAMRRVTFRTAERLVLIPVELSHVVGSILWAALIVAVLSGIGPGVFSLTAAWARGGLLAAACGMGVFAGAVVVPALLPRIPGTAFSVKGVVAGLPAGLIMLALFGFRPGAMASISLLLVTTAISSFLAMNFTGSTPFTSPSGVEKEMRQAMPWQAAAVLVAAVVWVGAAFLVPGP